MKSSLIIILLYFIVCENLLAKDGIFAHFETEKGIYSFELFFREAPLATINFIGLAEGTISEISRTKDKYYDGKQVDLVVPRSILLAGCPKKMGTGDLGYFFPSEYSHKISYHKSGLLGFDIIEPDKNSCRLFVSLGNISHLQGHKTVFGKLVSSQFDLPKLEYGDKIKNITIDKIGKEAREFETDSKAWKKALLKYNSAKKIKQDFAKKVVYQYTKKHLPSAVNSTGGMKYKILKMGDGKYPASKQYIKIEYITKNIHGYIVSQSRENDAYTFQIDKTDIDEKWKVFLKKMKLGEERVIVYSSPIDYVSQEMPECLITFVKRIK